MGKLAISEEVNVEREGNRKTEGDMRKEIKSEEREVVKSGDEVGSVKTIEAQESNREATEDMRSFDDNSSRASPSKLESGEREETMEVVDPKVFEADSTSQGDFVVPEALKAISAFPMKKIWRVNSKSSPSKIMAEEESMELSKTKSGSASEVNRGAGVQGFPEASNEVTRDLKRSWSIASSRTSPLKSLPPRSQPIVFRRSVSEVSPIKTARSTSDGDLKIPKFSLLSLLPPPPRTLFPLSSSSSFLPRTLEAFETMHKQGRGDIRAKMDTSSSEDVPQDLSKRKRSDSLPLYPNELTFLVPHKPSPTKQGITRGERENRKNRERREEERRETREGYEEWVSSVKQEPLTSLLSPHSTDVLQHRIMVAETVKSYPVNYPALIPLSPSVAGLGGYNPCSSSLLHPPFSPAHIMDQKPGQQQGHGGQLSGPHSQDTPVGLGANGRMSPNLDLAGHLRKKDIFAQRKQREFIPDNKKDDSYWDRRRRNNEAAKRSREKRRFNDMVLEQRVIELSKENHLLKAQLTAVKEKYGIVTESLVNMDTVMSTLPQTEQILAINKRTKFSQAIMTLGSSPSVNSLLNSEPSSPAPSYSGHDGGSPQHYPQYPPSSHMDEHDVSSYDPPTPQHYAPSPTNYYGQSALNLSAHTSSSASHSPPSPTTSHMEYSPSDPELCRRSPEAGMSLPHKLRHKSHLGDKDAAAQSLLALHAIKAEPGDHHHDPAEDSVGSSDERDSGISYSSSSSCSDYHRGADIIPSSSPTMTDRTQHPHQSQALNMTHYHHHHHQQQQQQQLQQQQQQPQQSQQMQQQQQQQQVQQVDCDSGAEYENTHLRSELERLASEVATLKYMLVRRPNARSEVDSDTSR